MKINSFGLLKLLAVIAIIDIAGCGNHAAQNQDSSPQVTVVSSGTGDTDGLVNIPDDDVSNARTTEPAIAPPAIDTPPVETSEARANCEQAGGKWSKTFVDPDSPDASGVCNMPTSDAGKPCTDSSQCDSWCAAPEGSGPGDKVVGTCFEGTTTACGQEVKNGIAQAGWCK